MGINWNTVPAFYNDSYTYMEWLGKVTAKVENHEERITQAEADIDRLQDDVADIKNTLDDHETRIKQAEDDIDALEGRMDTAEGDIDALEGRMDTAEGDIGALEGRMDDAETAIAAIENTSIPVLEEKVAENTANIIALQRQGKVIYKNIKNDMTVSVANRYVQYTLPTWVKGIQVGVGIYMAVDNTPWSGTGSSPYMHFRLDHLHAQGQYVNAYSYTSNLETYQVVYTVENITTRLRITINSIFVNGVSHTLSDITSINIWDANIVMYAGETSTPTSEKESYQASVRIFQDKTIPIDNRTASLILQYYSAASTDPTLTWASWAATYNTGHPDSPQLDTTVSPDTNKDGKIDAIDASNIMAYYANVSAGRTQYENSDTDKFYQWYLDGNPPRWQY